MSENLPNALNPGKNERGSPSIITLHFAKSLYNLPNREKKGTERRTFSGWAFPFLRVCFPTLSYYCYQHVISSVSRKIPRESLPSKCECRLQNVLAVSEIRPWTFSQDLNLQSFPQFGLHSRLGFPILFAFPFSTMQIRLESLLLPMENRWGLPVCDCQFMVHDCFNIWVLKFFFSCRGNSKFSWWPCHPLLSMQMRKGNCKPC